MKMDLTGKEFGDWKVLHKAEKDRYWTCQCKCGAVKDVLDYSLKSGKSKSCGHCNNPYIHAGDKFNHWTVLGWDKDRNTWKCQCDCGNIGYVSATSLVKGYSKSCGCQQGKLRAVTMISRYGETATNKVNSQCIRDGWQAETMYDKDRLKEFIVNLGYKPTIEDLASLLGVQRAAMLKRINTLELRDYINFEHDYAKSNGEDELLEYIKSICNKEIKTHVKDVIKPYELDIYMPELNLAFEFNGDYWHSEVFKDKKYHQNKFLMCTKKNIQLIQIFENEWEFNRDKIEAYIKDKINPEHVLYARKCKVKYIDSKDAVDFENLYHISGGVTAAINLGIYYNDKLIGVMTFNKSRFNSNYQYEIIRSCYRAGYIVVGGSERMLKQFIKDYKPRSIVSYCDLSKFVGLSYLHMGFKMNRVTEPNYVWMNLNNSDIRSRYQCMKQKLIKNGWGTEDQTENDIMHNHGYTKIWGCGNAEYVWVDELGWKVKRKD